jgi:hypothetical protein
MRTILCLQHFRAADPQRQREIDGCLAHNLRHPALAEAVVWVEPGGPLPPAGTVPVQFRPLARRLRFADWLRLAAERPEAIVVLINADIRLDAGFERLARLLPEPDLALTLTRHEGASGGWGARLEADPHWRQDCWAIRGDAPIDADLVAAAELPLGRPGSDNRLAHVLWCHGLRLSNPVLHLRALHQQQRRSPAYDRHPHRLFGACTYVHPALAAGEESELEHRIWSRQPDRSGGLHVQVEPAVGQGGLQSYGAPLAPRPEPAAGGPATPFQERLALADLLERARPLPSHELAGDRAASSWEGGLFLTLADLQGEGIRLSLLRPQRLAGLALRLPRAQPAGGGLRLRLSLLGEEAVLEREWPLAQGRAGGLRLTPDWPDRPVAWLGLTLEEGAGSAPAEAFAELRLLGEPLPTGADPPPLVGWGDRFALQSTREGLLARDRFWPHARQLSGLGGDRPLSWFAQAFVPPLLEWKPDWIPQRPGHRDARLHWQGAPIEAEARNRHAHLATPWTEGRERNGEPGETLHTYLALPWTVFLRAGAPPERLLAAYGARLRAVRAVLAQAGRALRVHTVCQAPDWRELEAQWRHLGVSDLWLCHPGGEAAESPAIRHHLWPVLPPETQAHGGRTGGAIPADWSGRPLLAGFWGGGEAADLAVLAAEVDVRLAPAGPRAPGEGEDFADELALLRRCRFALCPGGPAADPGRLWRALAAGAVPVLLGDPPPLPAAAWLLPDQPGAWQELALVWPKGDAGRLVERLRAIGPLAWSTRQLLGGQVFRAAQRRTCFDLATPAAAVA